MQTSFTTAGVRRGFFMAQPLAPGVLVYGLVFGVLASQRGLAWLEALLMSAMLYSGTAQLAVLQGWNRDAVILPLVITILVMNARYVLYGAAIQPWLSGVSKPRAWASLFLMGDGNWAMAMKEYEGGYRDAGFVLGSGLATFAPWVAGTIAGHLLAGSVPDPTTFGLDFMLVAFAAAIGVAVFKGRRDLFPAVAAACTAFLLHRWLPGAWYIVGAGIAGALAGAWRHGR
ncbi:MAG: AzlC family ABC transporter permease [Pseudomonadota bacterium]